MLRGAVRLARRLFICCSSPAAERSSVKRPSGTRAGAGAGSYCPPAVCLMTVGLERGAPVSSRLRYLPRPPALPGHARRPD